MYICTECGNVSSVNYKCCELCGCDEWEENNNKSEIQQLHKLNKTIIRKSNIDESEVKEIINELCGRNKTIKGEIL